MIPFCPLLNEGSSRVGCPSEDHLGFTSLTRTQTDANAAFALCFDFSGVLKNNTTCHKEHTITIIKWRQLEVHFKHH